MDFAGFCHRQDVDADRALALLNVDEALSGRDRASLKAFVHYEGYLDKQGLEVERFKQLESVAIPEGFEYAAVQGLSHECCQKLDGLRPASLGQASRVSGVTPAALTALMIHLKRVQ
jgi:tRNA uridine 5-carboxymethylaminomethyl modification enzyme